MKVLTCSLTSPDFKSEFIKSLRNTGFAIVTDTGIETSHMNEFYSEWAKVFSDESKHKFTYDQSSQTGYFPFKSEKAKNSDLKDLKEFWHFYFHRLNSLQYVPRNVQAPMGLLFGQLETLGSKLLKVIEDSTPSERSNNEHWSNSIRNSPSTLLRVLHYPPVSTADIGVRAAAHEDINLITLLPAASASGLQVQDMDGNWHEVESQKDSIIVNIGDMLQELTNGHYRSTTHRVVNPSGSEALKSRYSAPLFIHPVNDYRLSARYTAGEFLTERLKELGLLK